MHQALPCWGGLAAGGWVSQLLGAHAPRGCNSASFFRCFFGCVFGAILGRFWDPFWIIFGAKVWPKRLQKSMKNRHRKNYEKLCQINRKVTPKSVLNLWLSDIMLNMQTLLKHVFYCRNTVFFEGPAVRRLNERCNTQAQNRCLKNVRKIHDILIKSGPQNGSPKRRKVYLFRYNFASDFRLVFYVLFWSKMVPKGVQKVVPNWSQNHEKSMLAPRCHFRMIWGRFWTDFGPIWDRFLGRFGIDFDTIFTIQFRPRKTAVNRTSSPEIGGNRRNQKAIPWNGRK